jgi:hypothetical protein
MSHSPGFYNPQGPGNPPPPRPEEDPTHDVPSYPPQDSPPGTETAVGPGEHELPDEGEDDVDEDDLDPQVPHSPPDGKSQRLLARSRGSMNTL